MHAGDVAYAGTTSPEFEEWEPVWDMWEDQVQPIASTMPYMFAVGNHERYFNYTSYNTRFLLPGPQSGGYHNFWYSFDYSFAHFICFSTEHPYENGTQQNEWIVQDLQKAVANRAERPWIFVVGHRPLYCSDESEWTAHDGNPATSGLSEWIEPLLHEYNVDMMLTGHMHVYERSYPVWNRTATVTGTNIFTNPTEPIYIVQGNSGVFLDETWIQPQPSWSAVRHSKWGHGRFTINSTSLHYEYVELDSNEVIDDFWVLK